MRRGSRDVRIVSERRPGEAERDGIDGERVRRVGVAAVRLLDGPLPSHDRQRRGDLLPRNEDVHAARLPRRQLLPERPGAPLTASFGSPWSGFSGAVWPCGETRWVAELFAVLDQSRA